VGDRDGDITLYRSDDSGVWSFFQKLGKLEVQYLAFHLKGAELLCGSLNGFDGSNWAGGGELFVFNAAAASWQRQAEFRSSQPAAYGLIGEGARIDDDGYLLGSGFQAGGIIGGSVPPGTCHFFARPALDTYAGWSQRVFTAEQLATPLAQPDAVPNSLSVSNLMSYAMGLDPLNPDPAALPHLEFDPTDQRWGYRFQIRPNVADVSGRAASSGDLRTWSEFTESPNMIGYGLGVQTHFRKVSASATGSMFFRIEATPLTNSD
jgi:hypothetical protein